MLMWPYDTYYNLQFFTAAKCLPKVTVNPLKTLKAHFTSDYSVILRLFYKYLPQAQDAVSHTE